MISSILSLTQLYPISSILIISVCALMVGSVLSMTIYRLPLILEQPDSASFNLFFPRSHCVHCKKTIPFYYNIPLFSYLYLRGRCHHCRHKISWRYPIVEILTLVLSLLAVYTYGYTFITLWVLAFVSLTLCLGFIDLEHQLLPDTLTLGLLWLGLLMNTQSVFCTLPNAVWSAAGAYLCLWVVMKLFCLITGKIGMGHGDFKLFAAFGAWFGWTALIPILLIASTLGSVIGLSYLRITKQNRNTPIPFGPFLCIGGLATLFFPMLKQF
ncbi:MAG: A24 family peptidase [Gammaproteobacteria bacterium]|nr:A24 family peptidase [Gammaproteobacteria bacterium]